MLTRTNWGKGAYEKENFAFSVEFSYKTKSALNYKDC